jgi:diphosphomevalonate decarboxylase
VTEDSDRRLLAAHSILPKTWKQTVTHAEAFAHVNIALAKYWGKRDEALHLPVTDSFSACLALGTQTSISKASDADSFWLNDVTLDPSSVFSGRLKEFLDLVRPDPSFFFCIQTKNQVPTAAGLASSASGFAALTLALNSFFGWNLAPQKLSCLARLGSGSACRSVFPGFALWHKGEKQDGSDSYAEPFPDKWEELAMGIFFLSTKEKELDSRAAMMRSQKTSPYYPLWPDLVKRNLVDITQGIKTKDFSRFGQALEQNALGMHALMHTATPPFSYYTVETVSTMKRIWQARNEGLEIYFTMDAGPNIKAFFLKNDTSKILSLFESIRLIELSF